ncbi:MAG: hypothetical protein R3F56_21505 [Planctomycetota bacterium]
MRQLFLLSLLVPAAAAQGIPRGDAIVSAFSHPAGTEGLWRVSSGGITTQILGLGLAGSAGTGVNSVQLDPIDDRVWIGGINSNGDTSGQVNWIRLSAGGTVAQFSQHGSTGLPLSIAGITFDDNGNPVVASGRASGGGGIFRIDRATGASTRIASLANGLHNAITRDDSGNLYLGIFDTVVGAGGGEIYRMAKNPDCSYRAPSLLGTVSVPQVSSVAWCRDPSGGSNDVLLVTTFGSTFEMPATGGAARIIPAIGFLNWVDLDRGANRFLMPDDGSGPSNVFSLTRDYSTAALHASLFAGTAGTLSCIDSNDDPAAELAAIPACPARDVPVTVELGVSCPPGQLAIVHIVAPVSVPLLVAPAPGHGRVFVQLPGVVVPTGFPPGSLVLQAACFDPVGNSLVVGRPVGWPAN